MQNIGYNSKNVILYFLLAIVISLAYMLFFPEKPMYALHLTTSSNHLAVQQVVWDVDGNGLTSKSATFSDDSAARDHVIVLPSGQYSNLNITCVSPEGIKDTNCNIRNLSIFNDLNQQIYSALPNYQLNHESSLIIPTDGVILKPTSKLKNIKILFSQLLPVYLILICCWLLRAYFKSIHIFATTFSLMFIYALTSFGTIHTGMDAIENLNVGKYLLSIPHYYSYVEYRGYMWFLIICLISKFANAFNLEFYYAYAIYGSIIFALLISILIPKFIGYVADKPTISCGNIGLFGVAMVFLYGQQFLCPLPDITPLFFVFLSLYYLANDKVSKINAILAGIFIAIACLIRANYYIVPLLILICYGMLNFNVKFKSRIVLMFLFILPIVLLTLTNKIFVSKLPITLNNSNLSQAILMQGMQVQKTSPFEIKDARGYEILKQEHIASAKELTVPKYLKILLKHPMDFLTMYSIRLFNGLDIKYPQVYTSDSGSRVLFSLINYIALFFGMISIMNCLKINRAAFIKTTYIFAIAVPSLVMVASFVETRYFLSVSFILVSFSALLFQADFLKNKWLLLKLFIFIICCFTVSSAVYNQSTTNILFG